MPSPERWWLGRDDPPERPRHLMAGPVEFDLSGIDLRHIRVDGREVVSRIYVGVRDVDWDTIPPVVEGLDVRTADDGAVAVTFEARNVGAGIDLAWRGTISATAEGRIVFVMDALATRPFRYNRIGFCVLHPASVAGRPYRAWTAAGRVDGTLPELIAPQSIVDGVEIPLFPACSRLEVDLGGVTVTTAFEGDLFEMEDQRNWTDGSFKTYCTPISLGYPHEAKAGHVIRQRVELSVANRPARTPHRVRPAGDGPILVRLRDAGSRHWPALGLGLAPRRAGSRLPVAVGRSLVEAGLDHVRLDVHLSDPGWPALLERGRRDAASIGARLEVALFVDDGTLSQLQEVATRLARSDVARAIGLHEPTAGTATTPDAQLRTIVDAFAAAGADAPVLTGTNGDFAELNRDRPMPGPWAGVAYAMNPQVHGVDEMTLVESLPVHGQTVATARSFALSRAVVVSPVTLRGRFNPVAAEVTAVAAEPPVDDRQPSLFAAGWLLGSIASLVDGRADAITYFETHGPRGVIDASGIPFPAWFVLADLADRDGRQPVVVDQGTGPLVAALGMVGEDSTRVLIANLGPDRRRVRVSRLPGSSVRVRHLDASTATEAVASPTSFLGSGAVLDMVDGTATFDMGPFAYVRIDTITALGNTGQRPAPAGA
jgi:hypothetical protein